MRINTITIQETLEKLKSEGILQADDVSEISVAIAHDVEKQSAPWFVRALVAVSAWISAALFLVFILGANIVSSSTGSMALGSIVIIAALFLHRMKGTVMFIAQLGLAMSLAGQALLLGGIGQKMQSIAVLSLAAIVVSIALIAFYIDYTHRVLSTIIAVAAAVIFIYDQSIFYGVQALSLALATGAGYLWFEESRMEAGSLASVNRPVAYGLVVGLLGVLTPSLFPDELHRSLRLASSWLPTTVGLMVLLLALEDRLMKFHKTHEDAKKRILIFSGTIVLALASRNAPGIIGSIFVLVLGFHRGNRILIGLSLAFLAVFLSAYYYNMDITLLKKSYTLAGTGAGLLAFRLFTPHGIVAGKEGLPDE